MKSKLFLLINLFYLIIAITHCYYDRYSGYRRFDDFTDYESPHRVYGTLRRHIDYEDIPKRNGRHRGYDYPGKYGRQSSIDDRSEDNNDGVDEDDIKLFSSLGSEVGSSKYPKNGSNTRQSSRPAPIRSQLPPPRVAKPIPLQQNQQKRKQLPIRPLPEQSRNVPNGQTKLFGPSGRPGMRRGQHPDMGRSIPDDIKKGIKYSYEFGRKKVSQSYAAGLKLANNLKYVGAEAVEKLNTGEVDYIDDGVQRGVLGATNKLFTGVKDTLTGARDRDGTYRQVDNIFGDQTSN